MTLIFWTSIAVWSALAALFTGKALHDCIRPTRKETR